MVCDQSSDVLGERCVLIILMGYIKLNPSERSLSLSFGIEFQTTKPATLSMGVESKPKLSNRRPQT